MESEGRNLLESVTPTFGFESSNTIGASRASHFKLSRTFVIATITEPEENVNFWWEMVFFFTF